MAVNKISMGINYRKKTNSRMTGSGNYFAEVDRRETLTTRGLAEHLKEHGCLDFYHDYVLRNYNLYNLCNLR